MSRENVADQMNNSKKPVPPTLVLPTISCPPLICEQGPSIPSSPVSSNPDSALNADLMTRIQLFTSAFDKARLSPNYATSDLGSSARSSFSTASWMGRERSVDFDDPGKELISPFDCDTACSASPSYSLSPNSFYHFSFDAKSVSSLYNSTNHLNQLLTIGSLDQLARERSRSESDMIPRDEEPASLVGSTLSVPGSSFASSSLVHSHSHEIKRSSSTPPPTTSEREFLRKTVDESAPKVLAPKPQHDSILAEHERRPSAQQQYTCTICGQAFAVHDRLAKHIASRHRQRSCTLDDASKVHKCTICPKSFSRSDMLTRHMRLHTGAKPYSCPTCNQVFSRSDHLSTHLRTHTGEKPYGCPLCSYSASRRDMISRHMRTHSLDSGGDTTTLSIANLSIRSASTSPLPPKVSIGSGEQSAFKPIGSKSPT